MKKLVLKYYEQICAVNDRSINQYERVQMQVQNLWLKMSENNRVEFMINTPKDIYAVDLFYKKLYEKYKGKTEMLILTNLVSSGYGELNVAILQESDKKIVDDLNYLVQVVHVLRVFEQMVNLVKCIMYNYTVGCDNNGLEENLMENELGVFGEKI